MKFDVVIGNPPYCKGRHIKFLELALKLSIEVVFVEPAFFVTSFIAKNARISALVHILLNHMDHIAAM